MKLGPDQISVNIKYNFLRSLDSDQITVCNIVKPGSDQVAVNMKYNFLRSLDSDQIAV